MTDVNPLDLEKARRRLARAEDLLNQAGRSIPEVAQAMAVQAQGWVMLTAVSLQIDLEEWGAAQ